MITSSFGLTATERVLPRLALDFTTASLDSRVTFTRTTGASNPATYVDANGYVVTTTNNQPRFDYDPITKICKGLLIEESRQNAQIQSSDFTVATAWQPTTAGSTINGDAAISPSGAQDADFQFPANGVKDFGVIAASSAWSAATYTLSAFVKAGGFNYVQLLTAGTVSTAYANFDLANGVVGTVSGGTSAITNMGNGWYRVAMTFTANAVTAGWYISPIESATAARVAGAVGNGVKGLYLWGAQKEIGSFATSYIPTTTTALTRNADVATMTGTNFSDWYNQTEGTFVVSGIAKDTSNAVKCVVSPNAAAGIADENIVYTYGTSLYNLTRIASVTQANISRSGITANALFYGCFGYKQNDFGLALNASAVGTDVSGNIPTVDQMSIGSRGNSSAYFNGRIAKIAYYNQKLTNAEIQAFSKG